MVKYELCKCGKPSCKKFWLIGMGEFVQGSGFTLEEAQRICRLVNAEEEELAALQKIVKEKL